MPLFGFKTDNEDAMIDAKFEVPDQVRDVALRSLEQTEKAVSSFMASASKSMTIVPGPMTEMTMQALAVSERKVKLSFDHVRSLMLAKDLSEVMRLQAEYFRSQFGIATDQLKGMQSSMASESARARRGMSEFIGVAYAKTRIACANEP